MAAKKKGKKSRVKAGTNKASAKDRRAKFIAAYLANGQNATQAAITAGYSPKTAKQAGSRLLTNVDVAKAVAEYAEKAAQIAGLTVERTLLEVARLAYSDPRKFYSADGQLIAVHLLDDDAAACIASVEVDEINVGENVVGNTKKIKMWDKNSALEKAVKIHGLYAKDNEQNKPVVVITSVTPEFAAIKNKLAQRSAGA